MGGKKNLEVERGYVACQVATGHQRQNEDLNPKPVCSSQAANEWYRAGDLEQPGKGIPRRKMHLAFKEPTVCWGDGSDTGGGANRTNTLNHELFFFFLISYVCITSL